MRIQHLGRCATVRIHDGPGILSEEIEPIKQTWNKRIYVTSSFQCWICVIELTNCNDSITYHFFQLTNDKNVTVFPDSIVINK